VAGYKYALPGPPFNFLGHFSQTQFGNLQTWVNARTKNFLPVQQHYQIRAQQLRKLAGVLEQFAGTTTDQALSASVPQTFNRGSGYTAFPKEAWQPGPNGHFNYLPRVDHLPMVSMTYLKTYMKPQFQRDDELWFSINHVRTMIEKNEDNAQYANDAVTTSVPAANVFQLPTVAALISELNTYFAQNQYQAVLVKDQTDTYGVGAANGPRFRVHTLDPPTQYELEQMNASNPQTPIQIKELVNPST
jgi:hypothetical protein